MGESKTVVVGRYAKAERKGNGERERSPKMEVENQGVPQMWSTDICDCCADCESCCITYFIPSITYGRNKERIEGVGNFMPDCCAFFWFHAFCFCFVSCLSYQSRTSIRQAYNLKAEPCDDCCTHFWCLACALCQEARELKLRGATQANPALSHVQTVAPPLQTMMPQPTMMPPPHQQLQPALGVPAQGAFVSAPQKLGYHKI